MYDEDIPEQIIKEITGHKSECIHTYKCTSDAVRECASKIISGEPNVNVTKVIEESDEQLV